MAEIKAAAVKALRDQTQLPMMDCKRALVKADGDHEKAIEFLAEMSGEKIKKREGNVTSEGRIFFAINDDNTKAAMVEIQCESAPVAANDEFKAIGQAMADQLLNGPGAADADELLTQEMPGGSGTTLGEAFNTLVNKIREKFVVGRIAKADEAPFGVYVHHDGKSGALFRAKGDNKDHEVLRGVAMHITALKPKHAKPCALDQAAVAEVRGKLVEEAKASGKPDNIIDKIVDGRMNLYFAEEEVLSAQPYAKDDSKTVAKALEEHGLEVDNFDVWVLGVS